jgi:hypothetical protein
MEGTGTGHGGGICVLDDGPYFFTKELKELIQRPCSTNTELRTLLEKTLERGSTEADTIIPRVKFLLESERKQLLADEDLLKLQQRGQYPDVLTQLEYRVALSKALQHFYFGTAYGPLK